MFEKSFAYLQMKLLGQVIVPGVGDRGDVLAKEEALNEAHALGQRLATV
jgi:hypothetical protein